MYTYQPPKFRNGIAVSRWPKGYREVGVRWGNCRDITPRKGDIEVRWVNTQTGYAGVTIYRRKPSMVRF